MVHRHEITPLAEVVDGVAALPQQPRHENIGLLHAIGRGVDEPGLHVLPGHGIAPPRSGREASDLEVPAALGSAGQLRLCATFAAGTIQRAVVLGAELPAQPPTPAGAHQAQDDNKQHRDRSHRDDRPDPGSHDALLNRESK